MADRQYIVTERAHLMCPNMEFGILFTVNAAYDENHFIRTIDELQSAHPFLRAIIKDDENGKPYYQIKDTLDLSVRIVNEEESIIENYKQVISKEWNVYQEALLKILVVPSDDNFQVLLIAHHLLCDGRGLMSISLQLGESYVKGVCPQLAEEKLIESIDDLPQGSDLPWISKVIVNSSNKHWAKENHKVSYAEYLEFEKTYKENCKNEIVVESVSKEELTKLVKMCHDESITVNDYLVAKMMLEKLTNKVIVAADVRKHLKNHNEGSLGNYSTAFSVVCQTKNTSLEELAKKVSKTTKSILRSPSKLMLVLACYLHMTPELLDAIAISTQGKYVSEAGLFVGSKMFGFQDRNGYSISNLGRIESESILEATFIPPMSPANKQIIGVVTVNQTMNLCSVTRNEMELYAR